MSTAEDAPHRAFFRVWFPCRRKGQDGLVAKQGQIIAQLTIDVAQRTAFLRLAGVGGEANTEPLRNSETATIGPVKNTGLYKRRTIAEGSQIGTLCSLNSPSTRVKRTLLLSGDCQLTFPRGLVVSAFTFGVD